MSSADMRHMEHLEAVVASDVAVLRKKEATYQGSWKAAGGRSAWFMARRNLDRLLNLMRAPDKPEGFSLRRADAFIETLRDRAAAAILEKVDLELVEFLRRSYAAEDVFIRIAEEPSGADGTVLACVRDARRYFALVEAEMVARGVVTPEGGFETRSADLAHAWNQAIVEMAGLRDQEGGVSAQQVAEALRAQGRARPDWSVENEPSVHPGTPEDGGQHDATWPWIVGSAALIAIPASDVGALYSQRTPEMFVLEPRLTSEQHQSLVLSSNGKRIVREALSCYRPHDGVWTLDVSRAPRTWRRQWPVLRREYNATELRDLAPWQQAMFTWVHEGTGFRVRPEFAAWTVDESEEAA